MPHKNQVCSLESAERLKELRIPQDSLWYWVKRIEKSTVLPRDIFGLAFMVDCKKENSINRIASAFTVAELIYILREMKENNLFVPEKIENIAEYLAKVIITYKTEGLCVK